MADFSLTIAGVERKGVIDFGSFRVQERAGIATLAFTIVDPTRSITVADNAEVIVTDTGVRAFAGHAREIVPSTIGRTRIIEVTCQDYNALLDEDAIPAPASRSAAESDKQRVEWLVATHGTKGITAGTFVQTVIASMPVGEDGIPRQEFGGKTFREALDYIAKLAGADYRVDFNKELHWYPIAAGEGLVAPFGLSDTPNNTTTFAHHGMKVPRAVESYRNAVYVTGTGVSGWYPDPPPSTATRRAGVIRDEDITSQAQIDAAGAAYLASHGIQSQITCQTLRAGLRTGMTVQVTAAAFGLTASPQSVREVVTRLVKNATPYYDLILGAPVTTLGQIVSGAASAGQQALEAIVNLPGATGEPVADLTVGGANLLANSSFESSVGTGWSIGAEWAFGYEAGPSAAFSGRRTARVDVTALAVGTLDTPLVAVVPSEDYWVSTWNFVRSRSAGTAIIEVLEYASNGTTLLATHTLRSVAAADAAWNRVSIRLGPNNAYDRVPFNASTAFVRLRFRVTGTATMVWDVDGLQVERGRLLTAYAPSPYELMDQQIVGPEIADAAIGETHIDDDSITTAKVQAGAIDTNKLAASAVTAGKIAAGAITALHVAASGIEADKITSGVLSLGGPTGMPDILVVYDSEGDEIGRWDMTGLTITDPNDPLLVMRLVAGVLEFSIDGGVTWTTAMDGYGIRADAIQLGSFAGGHNSVHNSGFEMSTAFIAEIVKVWTAAADWGTTIGTDVNVTKTGNDLTLTSVTY